MSAMHITFYTEHVIVNFNKEQKLISMYLCKVEQDQAENQTNRGINIFEICGMGFKRTNFIDKRYTVLKILTFLKFKKFIKYGILNDIVMPSDFNEIFPNEIIVMR